MIKFVYNILRGRPERTCLGCLSNADLDAELEDELSPNELEERAA